MKRLLMTAILILSVLSLFACGFRKPESDRERVFRIVTENEVALRACVASKVLSSARKIEGIKSVTRYRGAIDFECGGHGFGPSTAYYGFCYVPDNDYHKIPYAEDASDEDTVVDGNRVICEQKDGDNVFYAEMIVDGFWYYYAAY